MSRPLTHKLVLTSILGLVLGASGMAVVGKTKSSNAGRGLASVTGKPIDLPRQMQSKHLSVVQVGLQTPDGIPESEDQETTLVGYVRLNQPLTDDIQYRWELPEGVRVVEGQTRDAWSGMQNGQTAETRLRVVGFSKEHLQMVVLHGFVQNGDAEFGNSASLTSRPEDSYEILTASSTGLQKASAPEELKKEVLKGKILR